MLIVGTNRKRTKNRSRYLIKHFNMRRFKITIGLIAAFLLASCGNSINSDAKKLADLQCKAKDLTQKMMSGDTGSSIEKETGKITKEIEELAQEIDEKYTSQDEQEELQQAIMEAMKKCQ